MSTSRDERKEKDPNINLTQQFKKSGEKNHIILMSEAILLLAQNGLFPDYDRSVLP